MSRPKKTKWDIACDAWDEMENPERRDLLQYFTRDLKRLDKREAKEQKRKEESTESPSPERSL